MSVQLAHLPYYYLNIILQVLFFPFVINRYKTYSDAAASTESSRNGYVKATIQTTGRK